MPQKRVAKRESAECLHVNIQLRRIDKHTVKSGNKFSYISLKHMVIVMLIVYKLCLVRPPVSWNPVKTWEIILSNLILFGPSLLSLSVCVLPYMVIGVAVSPVYNLPLTCCCITKITDSSLFVCQVVCLPQRWVLGQGCAFLRSIQTLTLLQK